MADKQKPNASNPSSNGDCVQKAERPSKSDSRSAKKFSGRIRTRKKLNGVQDSPESGGRVRHRPKAPLNTGDKGKTDPIRRASPEEHKSRPRTEPKPGRSYKPHLYAKNGMRIDDLPHEVGYAKLPERTKFKPGQCGNPKGRPRGKKNTKTLFREALDQKLVSRIGGKEKKITTREGIIMRLVKKALDGDHNAIKLIMAKDDDFELQALGDDGHTDRDEHRDVSDAAILEEFVRQIEEECLAGDSGHLDADDDDLRSEGDCSDDGVDDENP